MRKLSRQYERLGHDGGLSRIRELKNALVDRPLYSDRSVFDRWFWATKLESAEISVRQFTQDRYAGIDLNRALIAALGSARSPVSVPLPAALLDLLREHGLPVNRARSLAHWYWLALLRFAQGVILVVSMLGKGLTGRGKTDRIANDAAHLLMLTSANLPPPTAYERPYDICSWYANWPGRRADIQRLFHNVPESGPHQANGMPVQYRSQPCDVEPNGIALLKFAKWSICACTVAGLGLVAGRWWYALLLAEAAKAKLVSLQGKDELAAEYLFPFSANTYRPLWTYAASEKGSCISLYFYSTFEQIKLTHAYESQKFEWGAATWPRYIVWDEWQAAQLRRDLGSGIEIMVVGSIAFADSGQALPVAMRPRIAVFDVPPYRKLGHFGVSTLADYRLLAPEVDQHFVSDIAEALDGTGATMMLKRKRDIGKRASPSYSCLTDKLCRRQKLTMVGSAISAARLIAACDAAISIPFTSTALYARELGIPTVYYDPSGMVDKNDRAAHNITVLSGPAELRRWVAQMIDYWEPQVTDKSDLTKDHI